MMTIKEYCETADFIDSLDVTVQPTAQRMFDCIPRPPITNWEEHKRAQEYPELWSEADLKDAAEDLREAYND